MNIEEIRSIVAEVKFRNYQFDVVPLIGNCEDVALRVAQHGNERQHCFLRARFESRCAFTGITAEQHTHKWLLSEHMTRSEIVQTALKCVLASEEHEAREDFKYRGQAIFGPHFDVEILANLCEDKTLETDVRP